MRDDLERFIQLLRGEQENFPYRAKIEIILTSESQMSRYTDWLLWGHIQMPRPVKYASSASIRKNRVTLSPLSHKEQNAFLLKRKSAPTPLGHTEDKIIYESGRLELQAEGKWTVLQIPLWLFYYLPSQPSPLPPVQVLPTQLFVLIMRLAIALTGGSGSNASEAIAQLRGITFDRQQMPTISHLYVKSTVGCGTPL